LLLSDEPRWWNDHHAKALAIVGPQLEGELLTWVTAFAHRCKWSTLRDARLWLCLDAVDMALRMDFFVNHVGWAAAASWLCRTANAWPRLRLANISR
jgi:hypothetical protein